MKLSYLLVQSGLDAVRLLQPLQGEDQQVRVVFVWQGREGDRGESAALQPVHGRRVDSYGFLCCDVRAVLCDINNTTVNSITTTKSAVTATFTLKLFVYYTYNSYCYHSHFISFLKICKIESNKICLP